MGPFCLPGASPNGLNLEEMPALVRRSLPEAEALSVFWLDVPVCGRIGFGLPAFTGFAQPTPIIPRHRQTASPLRMEGYVKHSRCRLCHRHLVSDPRFGHGRPLTARNRDHVRLADEPSTMQARHHHPQPTELSS